MEDLRGPESVGSSDPLLQIPSELSAVLTLKRNGQRRGDGMVRTATAAAASTSPNALGTPSLLKKKRESIV